MYYETWEKFDEAATQYIPLSRLSEFVDTLEDPLRLPAPNLYKLVSLDIPICEDERMHCVDILDALTKNFLGTVGDTAGDLGDLKKGPDRIDYNPISSTLKRQREMFVARLIQRSWRNFVKRRHALALYALDSPRFANEDDTGDRPNTEPASVVASERGSTNSVPRSGGSRKPSVDGGGSGPVVLVDVEFDDRRDSGADSSSSVRVAADEVDRRDDPTDDRHRTDKYERRK